MDTKVSLCGLTLDNPLIPASGTFGYGYEYSDFYDINILGSLSIKGTTLNDRYGNEGIRVAETASGMLNSVGLQNHGVDYVIEQEFPRMREVFKKPAVANISGFSVEEYVAVAEKFDACDEIGILEINVSCPNVHSGGIAFGTDPSAAATVTEAVKKAVKKPVVMKLSPNVTDIAAIAKACENAGADGICLINTLKGVRIDMNRRRPLLGNVTGGLSGPAVFPVALAMIWSVYKTCSIPIIGCGGVTTASDVIEMMMAGATAVEVGAANLVNPAACKDIIEALPSVMKKYKIDRLSDIIGAAHREDK